MADFATGLARGLTRQLQSRERTRLELKLESRKLENRLRLQAADVEAQETLLGTRLSSREKLAVERQAFDTSLQEKRLDAEEDRLITRLGFEEQQRRLKAQRLLRITLSSAKANPEVHPEFFKPGAIEAVALSFGGDLSLEEVQREFTAQGISLIGPVEAQAGGIFGALKDLGRQFGALPAEEKPPAVTKATARTPAGLLTGQSALEATRALVEVGIRNLFGEPKATPGAKEKAPPKKRERGKGPQFPSLRGL